MADKIFVALRELSTERPLLCSDLVRIFWTGSDETYHEEIVILENLSRSAAGLFTGVPVAEGTTVHLIANKTELAAQVRHCAFSGNGYLISLAVDSESGWMGRTDFIPEHLLDVSRLEFD